MVDEKEKAQRISETMTDGLLELDLQGKIIQANPAALSRLGFTLQEITQKTHRDLTPAKWRQQESQVIQETNLVQHQGVALEQEYLRQNNSTFPVWLKPILLTGPDQKPARILILFQDLTRQKEQEQLQRYHLRQLNSLSLLTRKLQENDTLEQTIHFVLEALVAAMKYPEVAVPLIAIEDETFSTNKYSDDLEYGLTASLFVNGREAGEVTVYYSEDKPFVLPEEQHILETVAQNLGVWLAQKSAAQELAEFEEQYRSIFDNMGDGFALYEVKDEGRELIVRDWNRAAEKMYNLLRPDVLGQDSNKFFPALEKTEVYKAILDCWKSGETKIVPLVHYQEGQPDQYRQNIIYRVDDRVAVIFRDVTEDEKARQRLELSEQKFRSLIEGSAEAVYLHTQYPVSPKFSEINQRAYQMLHYTREELLALGPTGIDSPEYAALAPERMEKLRQEGSLLFESEHLTKEGDPIPVEINSSIVELGGQKYILSFVRDITERKQLERILHESEKRFRNLSDLSPVGIFFLNKQRENIYVNKKLISLSGLSFDECLGKRWRRLLHPDDGEKVLKIIENTLPQDKEFSLKFRIINIKNEICWISVQIKTMISADNQHAGFIGIVQDVTDLEKAKTELTNQLAFSQQLLEAIPTPVFYKDTKGIYLGCNQAGERFLGRSKEMIIGRSVYELSPNDLAEVDHQKDQELFSQPGRQVYESSIQQADGACRAVIFNKATYQNPDGSIAGLIGVITDITERKKAEDSLKEAKAAIERIINSVQDVFYVFDLQGKFIYWNKALNRVTGYSDEEIASMTSPEFFSAEDTWRVKESMAKVAKEGSARLEVSVVNKDGRQIPYEFTSSLLKDSQGNISGISGNGRDLTDRQRMEEELQKRLSELERFNKVTMEREKRIIELKKKVKELEQGSHGQT
ncbi:MAG: PAS domain S-box protein [Elusimicrobia bacterium]|nr:PAS domain S-box protein [Elusimicrobiota bacterium]